MHRKSPSPHTRLEHSGAGSPGPWPQTQQPAGHKGCGGRRGGGGGQQVAGVQLLSSHTAQDEALWATDTPN